MGKPMVRNLMKAGFEVHFYARSPEKTADVEGEGAIFHPTIADLCRAVPVVITMVGYPSDVEEVYFSENGILANVAEGSYLIDMTTTSPSLSKRIYTSGKARNLHVLDAPVTGGDVGAINASLSILVGGDEEDFRACRPIFEAVGNNITYFGESGSGQHAKMANQIVIAGTMSGISEAFAYAAKEGIDLQVLFDAISTGAAASMQMSTNGQKIIHEDYSPGFRLRHFVKDMKIASDEADKISLTLPVLKSTLNHYEELEEEGRGDEGTQVLITYYI